MNKGLDLMMTPHLPPGEGPKTVTKEKLLDGPWFQRFMVLAVIFMPFQYALTLSVGFPLKISEILGVIGIFLYAVSRRKGLSRQGGPVTFAVLGLALMTVLSAVVNVSSDPRMLRSTGYDRGFQADLLLYSGYAALALAFFWVLRQIDVSLIARAVVSSLWLCGAAVALQWAASVTGSTELIGRLGFRTLGVDGSVSTLRSGPFLEGQHLGFYAGAALIVALHRKSYFAAAVAAISIFYSQSTTAYIGIAAGVLLVVILKFSRVAIPMIAVTLVGVLAVIISPDLRTLLGRQLAKIGFTQFAPDYQFATTSLNVRGVKSSIAFDMANQHPLVGVGPGRFGAQFDQFVLGRQLPWVYSTDQTRPIAENAYAHIASELGYPALICFVILIVSLIIRNIRQATLMVMLGTFLAVGVATQSSWTFLPIWTFLGLLASSASSRDINPPDKISGKFSRRQCAI